MARKPRRNRAEAKEFGLDLVHHALQRRRASTKLAPADVDIKPITFSGDDREDLVKLIDGMREWEPKIPQIVEFIEFVAPGLLDFTKEAAADLPLMSKEVRDWVESELHYWQKVVWLRESLEALMDIIATHDASVPLMQVRDKPYDLHGLKWLSQAISAALTIGAYNKGPKDALKMASVRRGKAAKNPRAQIVNDFIGDSAKPLLEEHPDWSDEQVAKKIRAPLNARLAEHGLDPLEPDTLRKRIARFRTSLQMSK